MDVQAIRMHRFTLRFPAFLEREFQGYFTQHNAGYSRTALASGISLYIVFAYLDYVRAPGTYHVLWLIRLGVATPMLLALFLLALTPAFRLFMQPILVAVCLVANASVVVINVLGFDHTGDAYYFGIIVINMYLYTVGRVQWAWAAPVGVANVALYFVSLRFVENPGFPLLLTSAAFVISAMLLGMIACYNTDHMSRREFLHARSMSSVNAELQRSSNTDPLTGLLNRRGMMQRLAEEVARSARNGRAFSIAIADADHFKQVNDRWGHACGDDVLTALAKTIRGGARAADVMARWGGEEFLLLFPDTRLAGARIAAEQLRRRVQQLRVRHESGRIAVSITIGVVEVPPGEALSAALRRADAALYEGKRAGRNRTVTGGPAMLRNLPAGSKHHPGGETEQQAHAGNIGRSGDKNA